MVVKSCAAPAPGYPRTAAGADRALPPGSRPVHLPRAAADAAPARSRPHGASYPCATPPASCGPVPCIGTRCSEAVSGRKRGDAPVSGRESFPRRPHRAREDLTMTIFDHGAAIVPDIVTEAEEQRILLRIAQAPWLTDLSRRVQHYGFRYDYRGRSAGRHAPAPAFPRWADVVADRLTPLFDGRRPEQCIVNEYRPGQGIGMHADHASFGGIVVSLSLGDAWTMQFRPRCRASLRPRRAGVRRGRAASPPLRPRPARAGPLRMDARHRSRRQRAARRDPRLRHLPHPRVLISAAVPVGARGKVVRHPAGVGAGGEGEVERSLERGEREGDRERFPTRSSTHRHQPG